MVERLLAKQEPAGSIPVIRSAWECGNWRRKLTVNQSCEEHLVVQLHPLPPQTFLGKPEGSDNRIVWS